MDNLDRTVLVSLDIDGTLFCGEPPGPITADIVRSLKTAGFTVGSCSQNDIVEQDETWASMDIFPDFMVTKEYLGVLRKAYPKMERYIHIGDWIGLDDVIAKRYCFEFVRETNAQEFLKELLP